MSCSLENCKNNALMDNLCNRHLKQKCSICFEPVRSTNSASTKRLICGHSFHLKCILNWFLESDECPVCRTKHTRDPIMSFKHKLEEKLRKKYSEAIKSLERELNIR